MKKVLHHKEFKANIKKDNLINSLISNNSKL
jgi:hypothetical protein